MIAVDSKSFKPKSGQLGIASALLGVED